MVLSSLTLKQILQLTTFTMDEGYFLQFNIKKKKKTLELVVQ